MPTETDPHLFAARGLDSPTASIPAMSATPPIVPATVTAYEPSEELAAALASSPALAADPGPPPVRRRLSVLAAQLHRITGCGCEDGGDIDGHGVDFEEVAAMVRDGVLEEATAPAPVRAPVEAKVVVGAGATLAAAVVLAVSTAALQHIDAVRALIGDSPWSGPAVLAVGVVLTAAQSWAAYQAPHSPRPGSPESV